MLLGRGDHLPGAVVGQREAEGGGLGGEGAVGAVDGVGVAVLVASCGEAVVVGGVRGEAGEGGGAVQLARGGRQGGFGGARAVDGFAFAVGEVSYSTHQTAFSAPSGSRVASRVASWAERAETHWASIPTAVRVMKVVSGPQTRARGVARAEAEVVGRVGDEAFQGGAHRPVFEASSGEPSASRVWGGVGISEP